MSSKPLVLPNKHLVNGSIMGMNALTMGAFLTAAPTVPLVAAGYLGANALMSFITGYTTTAAVGGADMRTWCIYILNLTTNQCDRKAVVITVLNAYSGFALVAEGIWFEVFIS
jgi:NAD(P) transhydrogenase